MLLEKKLRTITNHESQKTIQSTLRSLQVQIAI